jgi:hypothetical protein
MKRESLVRQQQQQHVQKSSRHDSGRRRSECQSIQERSVRAYDRSIAHTIVNTGLHEPFHQSHSGMTPLESDSKQHQPVYIDINEPPVYSETEAERPPSLDKPPSTVEQSESVKSHTIEQSQADAQPEVPPLN